jgi:CheY-like chemotaxis protein
MAHRILVIDDEEVVLGSVKKALRKDELDVDTTLDAVAALEMLAGGDYDLVITDLMMPEIDGLELLSRLRDLELDIPAIMITGYPTIKTAMKAKRLGAFEYVTKPFARQELRSVVVRAIRDADARHGATESEGAAGSSAAYYLPGHSWVDGGRSGLVTVGMAARFAETVGTIAGIDFPSEGSFVEQGRVCLTVQAGDGVRHDLHAPLSGRVVEINRQAVDNAALVAADPEGKGWLFRIEAIDHERELDRLAPAG